MGDWLPRPQQVITHKHENPETTWGLSDVRVGDRYRCSCNAVFEVIGITKSNDRDRPDWISWERDKAGLSGIKGSRQA